MPRDLPPRRPIIRNLMSGDGRNPGENMGGLRPVRLIYAIKDWYAAFLLVNLLFTFILS